MAVCGQRDPLGPAPSDLQQYDVLGRVTLASIFSGFLHLLYTDYSSVRLGYHCVCLCVCVCFQHTVYFVLLCVSITSTNVTFMHTRALSVYLCLSFCVCIQCT